MSHIVSKDQQLEQHTYCPEKMFESNLTGDPQSHSDMFDLLLLQIECYLMNDLQWKFGKPVLRLRYWWLHFVFVTGCKQAWESRHGCRL
jgi:hypothetical protein